MKIEKAVSRGIIVIGIICIAAFVASMRERYKIRTEQARLIISQGPTTEIPFTGDASMENIREIRRAIAAYEKRIEKYVQDAAKSANYWKLLSVRLQAQGLHGDALEALQHAIHYAPEDPLLHYYTGISAGIMAKSYLTFPGVNPSPVSGRENSREQYYHLAEEAFLRAIELDSRYLRPRYSLGVLYVFDLGRPADAIPHLERYLEISRGDVDTMFILAGAFYMLDRFQEAVDLYDRIIVLTSDEKKRLDAQNNRQIIMGRIYG